MVRCLCNYVVGIGEIVEVFLCLLTLNTHVKALPAVRAFLLPFTNNLSLL
jgi:hypothetical protein